MCGRYVVTNAVTKTKNIVKTAINVQDSDNYNAHPYQNLPVVKKYKNGNTVENLKWGIIPSWAKQKDFKALINARLETIYEWKRTKDNKIPYYFFRNDKKTIFIAAIYDEGQFCMITEEASQNISEIHHRQPVILYEKDIDKYLNIEHFGSTFLKDCNKVSLTFHEKSKDVNKPTKNSASLIQQI